LGTTAIESEQDPHRRGIVQAAGLRARADDASISIADPFCDGVSNHGFYLFASSVSIKLRGQRNEPAKPGKMEITMTRIILALLCGLAVGLALGMSAGSSLMPGSTQCLEGAKEEATYMGQPTSFWIRQLYDRDPASRQTAMWALAQLGPREEGALRALTEMLKDRSEGVRLGAALNLGRMGPEAGSAIPQLIEVLRDQDQFVRVAAVRALGSISPHDDAVHAALRSALQDEKAVVRRRTLNILSEIGPRALATLPSVREALNDSDPEVREAAAEAFDKIKRRSE
jgi:HEAT repeat protein